MLARFFADVKCDRAQAVKASLLSNSALAGSVHPLNGQTTLQVAVQSAGESVIRALRRHGARWTDTDPQGNNAVHYVAQVARVDLCRYRKSADWVMALHAPNAAGDTPLHTTMALPDIPEVTEIIQAFVAVGADINRPNSEGKSALDLAEDRPELYQLMQDTSAACRAKPPTISQDGASQMGGGASFIGGGPSVLGSGPSSLGGHGSFIGGPGMHAYQHFTPSRGPQSGEPTFGAPPSPLRAGAGVSGDGRMSTEGGASPLGKASVAFGRTARTRSTSTSGVPHRSPHSGARLGARDGGMSPGASRSPQRRSRTPASRYSPPTSLRAIRTSAEAPAASAAAARPRRASASGATRGDMLTSTETLDRIAARLDGRTDSAQKSPAGWVSPEPRTAAGESSLHAPPGAPAPVDLAPLEKKVAEVQNALRHAKSALTEIHASRDAEKQQMGEFSKSIVRVSGRLDGIDSAVRTVASATAEAAEAAATGRKESVMEVRELKGHVESMWRDVSGLKEWQKDASGQLHRLRAQVQDAADAAASAIATADAAHAAAADAAAAAASASDNADAAAATAADVARQRDSAAAAAAPAPREADAAAMPQREASLAAERDARATDAATAAEAAEIAAEAATANAAAKAADAAAAMGAAEAVAAVSEELEALRGAVADVQAFRGPTFDTMKADVEELREFHSTAKLKFVEVDDALERLEELAGGTQTGGARALPSPRMHEPTAAVVPEEVADRLDEVWRKVGALESQVAGWTKAHGGADGEGTHGGSGASASPPRTPDAYGNNPDDISMDITSDLVVPPAPHAAPPQREITASKAGIYTNIYSGPTATIEFSMLSERLDSMSTAAAAAAASIKSLRADVDSLKARTKGAPEAGTLGALGPTYESDLGSGLSDLREQQMRGDAGRYEADAALGDLEERIEQLEHTTKLTQHSVAQQEDRLAGLMYSPGQARPSDAGGAALKNTVEQLETRLMHVEVQYAGRLQAQKAKVDQQGALITALMERVAALEDRCP